MPQVWQAARRNHRWRNRLHGISVRGRTSVHNVYQIVAVAMINYIKQFCTDIITDKPRQHSATHQENFRTLTIELNRLDPRDFEPSAQAQFLHIKTTVDWFSRAAGFSETTMKQLLTNLNGVLDAYRGLGSGMITRQFHFVADKALRAIVERDYAELSRKLFPSGAWKSTVIMAGSILEAILFDRLADGKWNGQAIVSKAAQSGAGKPIPMDKWRLENLIDIAVEIGTLKRDPADTIHQVLRDYRNFVHPKKEIRSAHACTEAEAMLALGALDSVCNYLEKNP
jgi:hypothetical protein